MSGSREEGCSWVCGPTHIIRIIIHRFIIHNRFRRFISSLILSFPKRHIKLWIVTVLLFCFLQTLTSLLLRARRFGLAQSRKRVYILMIKEHLVDVGELKNLVHIICQVLPNQLLPQATMQSVVGYNREVHETFEQDACRPCIAKDLRGLMNPHPTTLKKSDSDRIPTSFAKPDRKPLQPWRDLSLSLRALAVNNKQIIVRSWWT